MSTHMAPDMTFYTNMPTPAAGYIPLSPRQRERHRIRRHPRHAPERLGLPGDVLVVFSVSGDQPHIVRALRAASELGVLHDIVAADGGDAGFCGRHRHLISCQAPWPAEDTVARMITTTSWARISASRGCPTVRSRVRGSDGTPL